MNILRKTYDRFLRTPWLDKAIYAVLNVGTCVLERLEDYHFPENYLRRWKLDMMFGQYEKETVTLLKNILQPGMLVVDIGAHIGYFSRIMSNLVGPNGLVYALEPSPENFKLLKKNTKKTKNVKIFQLAAADKRGSVDFYQSAKTGCHSLISADFRPMKITVASTDLDGFLEQQNIRKIDLIKMDIEGGELLALEGMRKILFSSPSPALILEFNPECLKLAGYDPLILLKKIEETGFSIWGITPKGLLEINLEKIKRYQDIPLYPNYLNLYCRKERQSIFFGPAK